MHEPRLRLVLADELACRTLGCDFTASTALGFCDPCSAVYQAACELRERLLDRDSAHLHARHRLLFDALPPSLRHRLLRHMAAQRHHGRVPETGLEDLLGELHELGFDGKALT